MQKTRPEELVSRIAHSFNTYLGKGVRFEPVIEDVVPTLQIEDLETLLKIYFVVANGGARAGVSVTDFVERLQDRIRRVKTETRRVTAVQQGTVRGRVNWNETTKLRNRDPRPLDTRFVCTEPLVQYQIPENVVLVRLLNRIVDVLSGPLSSALTSEEYGWLEEWVISDSGEGADLGLSDWLMKFIQENVYLNRIKTPDRPIDRRTLRAVEKSRLPLYREAAVLLSQYRRLLDYQLDDELAYEFLLSLFIGPGDPETLFELYWIFRILDQYEGVRYRVIRGDSDIVAQWDADGYQYTLYHDSTGRGNVSFSEPIDAIDASHASQYLQRRITATERWAEMSKMMFESTPDRTLWSGRPDILLERVPVETEGPVSLFIGEVKYSRSPTYIRSGLRELLEYIGHVRIAGEYATPAVGSIDSQRVSGALFVDQCDINLGDDISYGEAEVKVYQYDSDVSRPL